MRQSLIKYKLCCVRWSIGQIILPTPLSTNASPSPTNDDIQKLLHYNAAQLANTSRNSAAARCHQLFNDAVSSSSSGPEINQSRRLLDSMDRLLDSMDCFQEDLTGRIDYDLYAIGLGILMIVASLLLIDPCPPAIFFTGQFVCCWALMIAGCHPLVCCSVAESSLLCDRRQLIAGPVLAILLCGSILIALLIVRIGSSRFIAEVVSLCRAFREVLSNYIKCDFLQAERPL
jgi:hypothetical protein